MRLDLHAGPLTRYYSGDWETKGQQVAREAGLQSEGVYGSGRPPWVDKAASGPLVAAFLKTLGESLGDSLVQPLDWVEGFDVAYQTYKPDHTGWFALLLVAAYLERPDLDRPTALPYDIESDPALSEAQLGGTATS